MSLICAQTRDNQIAKIPAFIMTPESIPVEGVGVGAMLAHWTDDPSTMQRYANRVDKWTDSVSGYTMTRASGSPALSTTEQGVSVNFNNYFSVQALPAFKSYAALCYWRDPIGEGCQFPILCGSSVYPYHGSGKNAALISTSFASSVVQNARIYDKTGYLNIGVRVNNLHWWDNWNVFIMSSNSTLPGFNRIGRDRTYHEFSGSIKDLMFFSFPLHSDAALLESVTSYLMTRAPV